MSVELFLELLLMLPVLVSHDVQKYFVRWSLYFEFSSHTSALIVAFNVHCIIAHLTVLK